MKRLYYSQIDYHCGFLYNLGVISETPASVAEKEEGRLPTTLNPFRYKGKKLSSLQSAMFRANDLEEDITRVDISINNLMDKRDQTLDRLSQTHLELGSQYGNIKSSISCGLAYLKMSEELTELSPQQLFDFFKFCLRINNLISKSWQDTISKQSYNKTMLNNISTFSSRQDNHPNRKKILDKMSGYPPEWFKSKHDTWEEFVALRADFPTYLNMEILNRMIMGSLSFEEREKINQEGKYYGLTIESEFPDWFSQDNGKIPTKEEVEQELEEDKAQQVDNQETRQQIIQRGEYIIDRTLGKLKKALVMLRKKEKEVSSQTGNFPDFILFLKATGERRELPVDNETFLKMTNDELTNYTKRCALVPSKSREKAIRNFVESPEFLTNPEPVALFLERTLRGGNVMGSAQDAIDDNFIDSITGICDDVPSSKVQELRNHDKKAHRTLIYDIKPILDALSPDMKSYLKELILDSKGSPTETIIWEIAILLSSGFKDGSIPKDTKSNPSFIKDIKNFTSDLLIKYWDNLYRQLQKSLLTDKKEEAVGLPSIKDQQEQTANIETTRGREEASEVQEIDTIIEEFSRGNLAGWKILYTTNRSIDFQYLKEIGGKTMEEREEELRKFLVQEHISASIKPGSVVRTIEWLVTIPQQVENLRIKQEVDGEVFRKIKRGKIRLFYNVFHREKRFIFFLHQKQQMSYPF